jgi:hypothetical protein
MRRQLFETHGGVVLNDLQHCAWREMHTPNFAALAHCAKDPLANAGRGSPSVDRCFDRRNPQPRRRARMAVAFALEALLFRERKQFLGLLPGQLVADAIPTPGRTLHIVNGSSGFCRHQPGHNRRPGQSFDGRPRWRTTSLPRPARPGSSRPARPRASDSLPGRKTRGTFQAHGRKRDGFPLRSRRPEPD